MAWRHGRWTVDMALPLGAARHAPLGQEVRAGDVVASGAAYGTPVRVATARRIGVQPQDLALVMRAAIGAEVERGTVVARTGRRFARAVKAPTDGRLLAARADGDVEMAPVIGRWTVRAAIDGTVTRADDACVRIEGPAWCLQGLAAYGPDAIGELTLACGGPADELLPGRVDTRQRGRILIGGGRAGPEAIARAHACGVAGVIAGAVPPSGLRHLYGEDVTAHGLELQDAPTVLCLVGFGGTVVPADVYVPLAALTGHRAAIHSATARLFVFAAPDAIQAGGPPVSLALGADWSAVRPLDAAAPPRSRHRFASEVEADAVETAGGPVPVANVLPYDEPRDSSRDEPA